MSACPFCQTTMRPTFLGGLPREECRGCGSVWFEGEALAKVMGGSVSDALIRRAKGLPGGCKGCGAKLKYVPSCPDCGTQAPTCPRCNHAPLPVVEALGVAVEVCSDCAGVALDPGELQQLQRAADAHRNEPLDLRPKVRLKVVPGCTACQRRVKPQHGFVWEEQLYCGSCAPEGAVPYTEDMSRAAPSAESSLPENSGHTAAMAADATGSALMWLFSRVFSR